MKNVNKWVVAIIIAVMGSFASAITYDYDWNANAEPSDASVDPQWTSYFGTGSYTQHGDSTGTIETTDKGYHQLYRIGGGGGTSWNHSTAYDSTIQFRLKVNYTADGAANAGSIGFNVGTSVGKYWIFNFTETDIVEYATQDSYAMDTTGFNTYKIVIDANGDQAHLYVGETLVMDTDGGVSGVDRLEIGDWSGDTGGSITWDYVQWTNGDACPFDIVGDYDGNCVVDLNDLFIFVDNWLVDCFTDPDDPACVPY